MAVNMQLKNSEIAIISTKPYFYSISTAAFDAYITTPFWF